MNDCSSCDYCIDDYVNDIQYIAEKNNLTYSAKTLKEVNKSRYQLLTKSMNNKVTEKDYIMCEMNYLLEIMLKFYGTRKSKGR